MALGALVLSPLIRHWYNRWNATEAELNDPMPSDDLVVEPRLGYTRAITIDAPAEDVWAWLAQFGQGRGGFYSYDGLENLIGCRIHSVDRILDEHQTLHPGDLIRSGPPDTTRPAWVVVDVEASHHLVLIGADPVTKQAPSVMTDIPNRGYVASTWQWMLTPIDDGTRTRLIVRQRLAFSPRQWLLWRIVEPFNWVMERKMLLGIRDRAEQIHEKEGGTV